MNDILESIDRFISNRIYHYALLVNGKWGCGKTYFIQNELIPHLNEKGMIDVNYMSLYGVRSTDEISQMLCVQAIKDKMGEVGKASETKGGQFATAIITAAAKLGLARIGADNMDLEKIIKILPDYSNNVIIFDDLERCCCDIVELLGYINNFVEHSTASVIIVANEEEIGNWQFDRNPELQMLVALDKRIDVKVQPTRKEHIQSIVRRNNNRDNVQKESYTLNQLDERRKTIFHNNENYKRIKEKVIGQTIDYEPDLEKAFINIIVENTQGVLQDILISMIKELVNIADRYQHKNLRTFQFFLEKASIIFDVTFKFTPLHQTILEYCYNSCVRYMMGMDLPIWDGDYGMQVLDEKAPFSSSILGFRFIDEFIIKNQFNKDYVLSVLTKFTEVAEKKGRFSDDPYQQIKSWYLLSDEELRALLVNIEQNIKNGKYSTELFTGLINIVANLQSYNIMTDLCNNILIAMKTYISNADATELEELEPEHYMHEGEAKKRYKEFYKEIEEQITVKKKQSEKLMYENAIKNENWGTILLDLVPKNRTVKGHSCIYWLSPKSLLKKISNSSNVELQQFRYVMQRYYDGYAYYEARTDDVKHLRELQDLLNKADKEKCGQIKKQHYSWIIGDIERYLSKLAPVDEA